MAKEKLEKLGEVEDVRDIAWSLFFKEERLVTLAVLFLTFVFVTIFILNPFEFGPFLILLPSIVHLGYISSKAQRIFMRRFAENNNFKYQRFAPMESVQGRLFQIGNSRYISNVIITDYDNHPVRIFNYSFTVGHGRNSVTYEFTVLEISFEKVDFPHIFLRSQKIRRYDKSKSKNDIKISLEGEFKDDFDLFVADGYQIEAMQIFTPETLGLIKEKAAKFSIEFYGKTLCIFDNKMISRKKDLEELHDVAKEVFGSMGPLLNRLDNDFEALHQYYRK